MRADNLPRLVGAVGDSVLEARVGGSYESAWLLLGLVAMVGEEALRRRRRSRRTSCLDQVDDVDLDEAVTVWVADGDGSGSANATKGLVLLLFEVGLWRSGLTVFSSSSSMSFL